MRKFIASCAVFALIMSLIVFYPNNSVEAEEYDENLSEEQEVEVLTEEEFNQYKAEGMFNPEDTYEDVISEFQEGIDNAPPQDTDEVIDSNENTFSIATLRGYTGSTGDILVTNDTVKGTGIAGHTGIMVSPGKVLHIPGPKQKVKIISISEWNNRYNKTNVLRVKNQSVAVEAARWAKNNYKDGSNPGYSLKGSLYSKSPTYCSKIVWQAFYYGSGSKKVMRVPVDRKVLPYAMSKYFYPAYKPVVVVREHGEAL